MVSLTIDPLQQEENLRRVDSKLLVAKLLVAKKAGFQLKTKAQTILRFFYCLNIHLPHQYLQHKY